MRGEERELTEEAEVLEDLETSELARSSTHQVCSHTLAWFRSSVCARNAAFQKYERSSQSSLEMSRVYIESEFHCWMLVSYSQRVPQTDTERRRWVNQVSEPSEACVDLYGLVSQAAMICRLTYWIRRRLNMQNISKYATQTNSRFATSHHVLLVVACHGALVPILGHYHWIIGEAHVITGTHMHNIDI